MRKAVQLLIEVDNLKNQHIKRKDNGLEVQVSPFCKPIIFGKLQDAVLNDEILSNICDVNHDLGYVLGEGIKRCEMETNLRGRKVRTYREYFPVQFYKIK